MRAGVPAVSFDLDTSRRRPGLLMSEEELAQVTWVEGDIADAEAVDQVVDENGVRAILHLAALQVPFCKADPVAGARVNVVGTVAVFEAARHHGLRRLAYASSIAAHGAPAESGYAPHPLRCLQGLRRSDRPDLLAGLGGAEHRAAPRHRLRRRPRPGHDVEDHGRDPGGGSRGATTKCLSPAPSRISTRARVAAAFLLALARDGDGAPAFDINGTVTPIEDGLEAIRRLAPGARVRTSGDPLPFPMEDQDALLRAHIGDYGAISLEDGTAETFQAFQVLLQEGRVSADF